MSSNSEQIRDSSSGGAQPASWNFFSKHAHLLFLLAANPSSRVSDLAREMDMTDRSIRSLLRTLEAANVVTSERVGRNNCYSIDYSVELTHILEKKFLFEPVVNEIVAKKVGEAQEQVEK